MKTNAKQRAEFGTAGGVTHYTPDEFTRDLIADVEDATALLGEAGLAISTGAGTYDLAQRITDFLKEPK